MAEKRNVLVIIPARGGSKRLPRKNILPLAGKPLIVWTIEAALDSNIATKIIVSSDDDEILEISTRHGVTPLKRERYLASDTAKTLDVVLDCIMKEKSKGFNYDDIILLQPTSPLRGAGDVVSAYNIYKQKKMHTVVSVCEVDHPIQWTGRLSSTGEIRDIDFSCTSRSQDFEKSYRLNGAIYICSVNSLLANKGFYSSSVFSYIMPRNVSLDIDTELDFKICESILGGSSN